MARQAAGYDPAVYTLRFEQLDQQGEYDVHDIAYTYDALSRLQSADYSDGDRVYDFNYDEAGNRLQEALSGTGVTAKVTDYEYNAVNQISRMRVDAGAWTNFSYNRNGSMLSDGINTLAWDRANRLLATGGVSYQYDGLNNRVQRTSGINVADYLLDQQPGLAVVLSETTGPNTTRYVHGPRGIHAQKDASGNWEWMAQDGLGSVRGVVNNIPDVLWAGSPAPYGTYFNEVGTRQSLYLFTGEYTDPDNELVHLRARDYNPVLGVFPSLDPYEGAMNRAMSLNGHSWVEGNPVMMVDPSGMSAALAQFLNAGVCLSTGSPCLVVCLMGPFGCIYFCDNGPQLIPPTGPITDPNEELAKELQEFIEGMLDKLTGEDNPADIQSNVQSDTQSTTRTNQEWGCTIPEGKTPADVGIVIEGVIVSEFRSSYGYEFTQHNAPLIPYAHRSGDGREGKPDLVLRWDRILDDFYEPVEIYEIKPISWSPEGKQEWNFKGRRQLQRYVDNFWHTGEAFDAEKGVQWNPNGRRLPYPLDSSQNIVLYTYYTWYSGSPEAGMVYYSCEDLGGN